MLSLASVVVVPSRPLPRSVVKLFRKKKLFKKKLSKKFFGKEAFLEKSLAKRALFIIFIKLL
jgi:hypothetical protein